VNYLLEYPKKVWLLVQNLLDLETTSEIRLSCQIINFVVTVAM